MRGEQRFNRNSYKDKRNLFNTSSSHKSASICFCNLLDTAVFVTLPPVTLATMKFHQIYFLFSIPLSAKASAFTRRQGPSWNTATCTTPEVTDASIDQTIRWNSVDTEGAWKAVIDDWKAKSSNGLTFTQEVSNFFNGPEQMLCGDISARDGCGSYVICNNVNHPAGMFILNSFVAISSVCSTPVLASFKPLCEAPKDTLAFS